VANDNVSQGLIPPIDANVRCAIGLAGDRNYPVLNTVDAYNRANANNLLIMLKPAAALAFGGKRSAAQYQRGVACPNTDRMTNPSDMPVHIRRLVNDFDFGDRTQLDPVVPSLLRHLCDAPLPSCGYR
jgi:hypothetical protein